MKVREREHYTGPVVVSIILHALLVLVFVLQFPRSTQLSVASASKKEEQPKIVHAVVVDQQQVMAEVKRLRDEKRVQQQAELSRQKRLQQRALAAERQREQAARKLVLLKKQQRTIQARIHAQQVSAQRKANELAKKLTHLKQEKQQAAALLAKQRTQLTAKKKEASAHQQDTKNKIAKLKAAQQQALRHSMQQQLQQEQQQLALARQKQMASEVAQYKLMIVQAIGRHWLVPEGVDEKASCQLLIELGPGGVVLHVTLKRTSGNAVLDRSAQAAVQKASPLPVPGKPTLFNQFRQLLLTVRPKDIRSS